jgi:RsiW-degrading membrane proteinase PrsW (M82 family)
MRYFYQHDQFGALGPYTPEELRALYWHGVIRPETPVRSEGSDEIIFFRELLAQAPSAKGGPPPLPAQPPFATQDSFTRRAGDDLRTMLPHLTVPLEELRGLRWFHNRRALSIACIGLLPLVIYAVFGGPSQVGNALWAMALYFSVLWALFFYYVFPTPEARFAPASLCFFATGILSIAVLLQLYRIWPLSTLVQWTQPDNSLLVQWLGFVVGVGIPEEMCKVLAVLFLVRHFGPFAPRSVLFYGLISGLGFGIYEGLSYQTTHNFRFAVDAAGPRDQALYAAEYYLLNLIRLTTLPFLHAIWTGTAGYFIGFAAAYPERKRGLLIVALGLPAFLHGSYNAFSGSALGLGVALLSVLALNLYLSKSVDFERLLSARR